MTMLEIEEYLKEISETEDIEASDLVILPPDVNNLSDEDEIDDDETGECMVNEVPGPLESHAEISDKVAETENNIDSENIDTATDTANSSRAVGNRKKLANAKKRKLCNSEPVWEKKTPEYTKKITKSDSHSDCLRKMRESLKDFTPVTIFEEIMSPKIFEHIVKETVRYSAVSKNKSEIVTVEELKTFIGILMFSSYLKLSSTKNYWSNDDDLGILLVKTAMARNRFQILKSIIHFCDNSDCEKNNEDRGFKVRPLISMIQKYFIKFGVIEECLAVDEMIVRYYNYNSLKQFIRSKPIRFGYKLWALCGASGYCYKFDLYCGKSVQEGPHKCTGE